jgi:hypothetical protein
MTTKAFYANWSEEDQEYVGLSFRFPSLSYMDKTEEGAIAGIKHLVEECMTEESSESDFFNTPNTELLEAIAKLRYEFDTRLTKDLQTYDASVDERLDKLKEEMRIIAYDMTMKALYNSKPQTRHPQQGQEALFWKEIKNIFSEEAPDSPKRLWSFMAQWAKDNNVPGAIEIYQHGGNYIRKGY